jgi:hypothetical protein
VKKGPKRPRPNTTKFIARSAELKSMYSSRFPRVHPGKRGTRYDGPRTAANTTKLYKDDYSRITGETDVTRIEWRLNGSRALRAAGIHSARDLLDFDHYRFWKKRLRLFGVDIERLGRLFRIGKRGRKRSLPTDERMGRTLLNSVLEERKEDGVVVARVQKLIDNYGSARIRRALVPIAVDALLPTTPSSIVYEGEYPFPPFPSYISARYKELPPEST